MKKYYSILLVLISFISISFSQENDSLTLEKIWKHYDFFENGFEGFRATKDGKHYSNFELNERGEKSIVRYSMKDLGESKQVLVPAEELHYNGYKLDVDSYEFNEDETKLLLLVNRVKRYRRSFYAQYFLYDLATKKLTPLDNEHSPQTLASYSPDGKKVAYIYDNDLWVKDLMNGKIKQLTKDGKQNEIINGTTDWVYEEEFAITKAYDWSPNSEYIAYLKFDESEVKNFNMEYYGDLYPKLYTFKYPKAGEDNSKVNLHVLKVKNGKSKAIELPDYEYIPRLKFSKVENKLMALTLNRHQNHIQYHWIDVENRKMPATVVYEEKDPAFVEIDDNLDFFSDGNHFIRTSEQDGYNHIYKIGLDGSKQQITSGEWDVIDFKGIDEEKNLLYYTSAEEGPQYTALYAIQLDGKNKEKLSQNKGVNEATFTPAMNYFANKWSTINHPPVYTLHKADGTLIEVLEENEYLEELITQHHFQNKKFIHLEGYNHQLNAWILYPPKFDSTQQYPVYFTIYGGPGSNMVRDSYSGGDGAYHQLLAQHGYIVISVDPRGTMYRGAKFKRLTYQQLGKLETEDMIAVAKEVGDWDFVDENRIGIMGWSYGGYMAALAMTKGAPYFKMGIAVAPVTNWRYYDNIYTERFMRTPQENSEGYDDNSPINFVDLLEGKLFLIHGTGDDNVHVQNTYEMINALTRADKDFDLLIYPDRNHGIYGGNTRNHLFRKMFEYTLENL